MEQETVRTIKFLGMIVRVRQSFPSDEERARRMKQIHGAAARLLRETEQL